ncbi:MAG: AmmeMemoRadiSam system protein A [Pseudomonadota bacterium]
MQTESNRLTVEAQRTLLRIARESILHGLDKAQALEVHAIDFSSELQVERASFVTLNRFGQLRGCIGHLEACMPLVEDVAENAYSAAFRDPRFPSLARNEYADLDIHISVLTPAEPLAFTSESDLLKKIRPGIDGLILVDGLAKGTFLPSVWASLPKAEDFLRHLKHKAGLAENHWSETLKVYRYETESFPD